MAEYLETALEGLWIVAIFCGLLFFVGAGATRLLLPGDWRRYLLPLTPVIGWCLLVLGLYALNLVMGARVGVFVVLALAAALNVVALRKQRRAGGGGEAGDPAEPTRDNLLPLLMGLGLMLMALAPQVVQRSLSLLSLNGDEELYYPAAAYVLSHPSLGDPRLRTATFLEGLNLYGWAFQYTMAAVSAVSGSVPYQVYIPTSYGLLGLSVPAWYLFYREVYPLGPRAAAAACLLYSLLGLPLWFGAYGYGPQMGSLVAIPAGTAAFLAAVERGGVRRLALAGLIIAVGLNAYYRAIALHYVFTLLPVLAVAVARQHSLQPGARALGVAALAFLLGLPGHWPIANWYFVQGAIRQAGQIGQNWSEGWGITRFQPLGVGLGTQAYELIHDGPGMGPLALLYPVLSPLAPAVTWLILAVAALGLVRAARARPHAAALLLGFAAYLAFDRFALDFKYGYFKLLAVLGPLVCGLLLVAASSLPRLLALSPSRPLAFSLSLRAATALFLGVVVLYLGYNSYETLFYGARGWGLSTFNWVAPSLHEMGKTVEPGARVFIAGRFQYPVPPDRTQVRKDHTFALMSEEELRNAWSRRVRAMAMTELLDADVYGWFDTHLAWRGYHRLLEDEDYDYYLLASENDPRLEGLDARDVVWGDPALALYKTRGVLRQTPWSLWKERGSLAITPARSLSVAVSRQALRTNGTAGGSDGSPGYGRLRLGILAFSPSEALVRRGDLSRRLAMEPGITWFTTPTLALPSTVVVEAVGEAGLGVVSLRLLEPGSEEWDLVPERVIRDDVYVSSSVLRLEHWLTDPFRGKKPGST